jgi:hypothetical protein
MQNALNIQSTAKANTSTKTNSPYLPPPMPIKLHYTPAHKNFIYHGICEVLKNKKIPTKKRKARLILTIVTMCLILDLTIPITKKRDYRKLMK